VRFDPAYILAAPGVPKATRIFQDGCRKGVIRSRGEGEAREHFRIVIVLAQKCIDR
jgi:hypothetical protein